MADDIFIHKMKPKRKLWRRVLSGIHLVCIFLVLLSGIVWSVMLIVGLADTFATPIVRVMFLAVIVTIVSYFIDPVYIQDTEVEINSSGLIYRERRFVYPADIDITEYKLSNVSSYSTCNGTLWVSGDLTSAVTRKFEFGMGTGKVVEDFQKVKGVTDSILIQGYNEGTCKELISKIETLISENKLEVNYAEQCKQNI